MPGGHRTGGEHLFAKGQRIDRYEIREPIGQGGMGAVYRAFDTKLGRMVALKTVVAHRRGTMSEELRQRFMREALAASKVDHRNVVRVLDFGFTEDGLPFIVMEFLRGQDLGARLRQQGGPLPVELVVDVMLGVCAALRACHQAGIIHRDLKPANIFLADADTGYEVKVLDFGVSKAPLAGDLTEDGQILGTPQYLSPEQVDGRTVPESDQYALGMLLYACLTNRLPYERHQNISLLRAIELGKFDPPRAHRPDLPVGLEAIILQALRISPADRFASVHALGQRLWEFASPNGREQWRAYYFQPAPIRPKESTVGVAVIDELARGTLRGPGPGPVPALAPTEALNNVAPPQRTPAPAPKPGPQAFISTKLARPESAPSMPAGAGSAEGSLIDVAGESATRHPSLASGRNVRRTIVAVLGGALCAVGVLAVRARSEHAASAPQPSSLTPPAPSPSAPAPATGPGAATPAPSGGPAAERPIPAAPLPREPAARTPPARAATEHADRHVDRHLDRERSDREAAATDPTRHGHDESGAQAALANKPAAKKGARRASSAKESRRAAPDGVPIMP